MTNDRKVQLLIREVAALPEPAQVEIIESLIDMRVQHAGIYQLDEDEREALARSEEDVRLGRFASDEEIDEMYARYQPDDDPSARGRPS
jgi:hypothetical protein